MDHTRELTIAYRKSLNGAIIWGVIFAFAALSAVAALQANQSGQGGGVVFYGALLYAPYRFGRHVLRLTEINKVRRDLVSGS